MKNKFISFNEDLTVIVAELALVEVSSLKKNIEEWKKNLEEKISSLNNRNVIFSGLF